MENTMQFTYRSDAEAGDFICLETCSGEKRWVPCVYRKDEQGSVVCVFRSSKGYRQWKTAMMLAGKKRAEFERYLAHNGTCYHDYRTDQLKAKARAKAERIAANDRMNKAAPDMLSALVNLTARVNGLKRALVSKGMKSWADDWLSDDVIPDAEAAIAKARP